MPIRHTPSAPAAFRVRVFVEQLKFRSDPRSGDLTSCPLMISPDLHLRASQSPSCHPGVLGCFSDSSSPSKLMFSLPRLSGRNNSYRSVHPLHSLRRILRRTSKHWLRSSVPQVHYSGRNGADWRGGGRSVLALHENVDSPSPKEVSDGGSVNGQEWFRIAYKNQIPDWLKLEKNGVYGLCYLRRTGTRNEVVALFLT
ncbi:uncharacterized protein BT62DRAFT_1080162 [Guyanagaster necrorhizus]|uniref:Uncharacterized protein n=1 Tax=Guyanagaster necrorhizus TaxID=856835 RepID=A0A9P7VJ38_9AGAR|nr:uncharacterized protein BT62DRAFT_1080162 [Guyanagaster necrorhizus MCA 3950]KAG7441432.1 hypothetical protein BT62DRAFT_1080162 [Guyanagaster necrorhizus MCA 3950]